MAECTKKCVWNMGTPCSGKTTMVKFFEGQVDVPVCEAHIEQHEYVVILHNNDFDIEYVLQQTPDWIKEQVLVLKLSGLDNKKVTL